jgi:hypothetical protein
VHFGDTPGSFDQVLILAFMPTVRKEPRTTKLRGLFEEAREIYNTVAFCAPEFLGMAFVLENPGVLAASIVPAELDAGGVVFSVSQCLGLGLPPDHRSLHRRNMVAAAKRILHCDSLELTVSFLVRAARILRSGKDPVESNDYFDPGMRELWNAQKGRAGALLAPDERLFFQKCAAPLRNLLRHNNAILPPHKRILYDGKPFGREISLRLEWREGGSNKVDLDFRSVLLIFETIRDSGMAGLQRALREAN